METLNELPLAIRALIGSALIGLAIYFGIRDLLNSSQLWPIIREEEKRKGKLFLF